MNTKLAIQANEQGHPILVEFVGDKLKAVDSERWTEILLEGGIQHDRAIVPIEAERNPDWIL